MKLHVKFTERTNTFSATLAENDYTFKAEMGSVHHLTKYIGGDVYEGDYVVKPKVEKQTIPTKNKVLTENVEILSIPYFEVSNTSGGNTVFIGSEV